MTTTTTASPSPRAAWCGCACTTSTGPASATRRSSSLSGGRRGRQITTGMPLYYTLTVSTYSVCILISSLLYVQYRLQEVFIPFSLGRRNCIGMNLAMLETKLAAATILRYYFITYLLIYTIHILYTIHVLYTILRSFTFERVNKGNFKYAHLMTMFPDNEGVYIKERV